MDKPKRPQSILIPYKIKGGKISVFLQKRSINANRLPGYFGFFGGGIDNHETPEQAMLREMKEELNYTPKNYYFLDSFEFARSIKNTYYMEAPDDFENSITINKAEGEYGKYFTKKDALDEPLLIDEDKTVLTALFKKLK